MKSGFVSPYNGNDPYIFVSFSHRNQKETLEIVTRLMEDGYRVWYDEGIDPGTEWDENIAAHVESCSFFLALMSTDYLNSSNCKDELNYARELEKQRVLIYLENVELPGGMKMRLSRLQAIHKYTYSDPEDFFRKLYMAPEINICHKEIPGEGKGIPEAPVREEKGSGEAPVPAAGTAGMDENIKKEPAEHAGRNTIDEPEPAKAESEVLSSGKDEADKIRETDSEKGNAKKRERKAARILLNIVCWICAVIFAWSGIMSFFWAPIRLILCLLIAVFFCPPIAKLMNKKEWVRSRKWFRAVVIVVLLLLLVIFILATRVIY